MVKNIDINHLCQLYLSGKSVKDAAKQMGIGKHRARTLLGQAGITVEKRIDGIGRKLYASEVADIISSYTNGVSENSLAKRYGIARKNIRNVLIKAGVHIRGQAEANALLMSQRTPEEHARNARAAHDAVRGKAQPQERLLRMAKTREIRKCKTSPEEHRFASLLVERGLTITQQKAVDRYNVDIAVHEGSIAVEIMGGGYTTKRLRTFRKRLDVLINNNWTPILIAVQAKRPFTLAAINYVVAVSQIFCRNPSLIRQEHVITGNAQPTSIFKTHVPYNAAVGGDKCGDIVTGPDGRFTYDTIDMEWWVKNSKFTDIYGLLLPIWEFHT